MRQRLLTVTGTDYDRGRQIGESLRDSILTNYSNHLIFFGSDAFDDWSKQSEMYIDLIKEYAIGTYEELKGMADGSAIPFEKILALTTAYEKSFECDKISNKCTSFAVSGEYTKEGNTICGQTNDEQLDEWLDDLSVVIKHIDNEKQLRTLIYTHPGASAYMGINSEGLAVQWTYIDNAERSIGLPTNIIIRELLRFSDVASAGEFLNSIPHGIPNQIMLVDKTGEILSTECFPSGLYPLAKKNCICHTNHILIDSLMINEQTTDKNDSTFFRLKRIEEMIQEKKGEITVDAAKEFLCDHKNEPQSICVHPHYYMDYSTRHKTLAALVFDLQNLEMNIAYGNPCETPYNKYSINLE